MRKLILLSLSAVVLAQQASKIDDNFRARFWRAQAEYKSAQIRLSETQAALASLMAEGKQRCGDMAFLPDRSGEPSCQQPQPEGPK